MLCSSLAGVKTSDVLFTVSSGRSWRLEEAAGSVVETCHRDED